MRLQGKTHHDQPTNCFFLIAGCTVWRFSTSGRFKNQANRREPRRSPPIPQNRNVRPWTPCFVGSDSSGLTKSTHFWPLRTRARPRRATFSTSRERPAKWTQTSNVNSRICAFCYFIGVEPTPCSSSGSTSSGVSLGTRRTVVGRGPIAPHRGAPGRPSGRST